MSEKWGVVEVATGCWLGVNDAGNGPKLFDSELFAKVAATIANECLDPRPLKRRDRDTLIAPMLVRVERYSSHGPRRTPDLVPLRSGLTALRQIEARVPSSPPSGAPTE